MIHFDEQQRVFHLQTARSSTLMQILRDGWLVQLHWGARIERYRGAHAPVHLDRGFSPAPDEHDRTFSPDSIPQAYPTYGSGDFRTPACQVQRADGSTVGDLRYVAHRILAGKPALTGLPAVYTEDEAEAQTLEIELQDPADALRVTLRYTVLRDFDAIVRSVHFDNRGAEPIRLLRALSASVDFRDTGFEWLTLDGAHVRETQIHRAALRPGIQSVESRRGHSSHQHHPFHALLRPGCDEAQGEAYGFSLVYSGNFVAQAEVDQFGTLRANLGINPFDFSWLLEPGESFQTPEAVLAYSDQGLGGLSLTYNRLYRTRLCRGPWRDAERPILVNNWEATYFDFDADKIEALARAAQGVGIEMLVLDDGWFGRRDNDLSSLGDWVVDRRKLPLGLDDLARRVTGLGLRFGLWFEPEMISPDSDLYRAHPDWCLHVAGRRRTVSRNQLVLDLSRPEVCDHLIEAVSNVLASAPIGYVKWDMNRHMTEIGSAALPPERQRETAHRYMLGLYRVLETITQRFPQVLFEGCSGGGGRFDPGMLHYMPQTWTSDNTDAVCRLAIQHGTSLIYPASSMGAHVSAVPNHQVHRHTPLRMRGHVAMMGNLGYELDLTRLPQAELDEIAAQVALYKQIRPLVQFGQFIRLQSPFEGKGNETSWLVVDAERTSAVVMHAAVLCPPQQALRRLRLRGLDAQAVYRDLDSGQEHGGDELMHIGLPLPLMQGDHQSCMVRLQRLQDGG
jgi:alpha-galactosidase